MSLTPFLNSLALKCPGGISCSVEPEDLLYYGQDTCHHFSGAASAIIFPQTIDHVAACIKTAREHCVAIVPSGGRTGYSGGATATKGEIVLSLERLNRVIEVDTTSSCATVEAGVTVEALQQVARAQGLMYAVDFGSRGSALIGGSIATNAGGIRVIRYGMTRAQVMALTVVTGSGEILKLGGKLTKNNTGFDLMQLFVGSEGVLGIIAEATLKLTAPPPESVCACLALNAEADPAELLAALRKQGAVLALFEFMDDVGVQLVVQSHGQSYPFRERFPLLCLVEIETSLHESRSAALELLEGILEDGLARDIVVADSSQQRKNLFALRELIGETLNRTKIVHKNDISVPISQLGLFCREAKAMIQRTIPAASSTFFGHVGDGNIHVNVIKPEGMNEGQFFKKCEQLDGEIFSLVQRCHGSISAEHGVGLLKKPYLHFTRSPNEIALMRQVKKVFDPDGILNPGKIFDAEPVR